MFKEQIFKANDVRGIVTKADSELGLGGPRKLGAAFVELLDLSSETLVMSHDMWQPGEEFPMALTDDIRKAGASIVDLGPTSIDLLWFGPR